VAFAINLHSFEQPLEAFTSERMKKRKVSQAQGRYPGSPSESIYPGRQCHHIRKE
jgi:hypothetical protein